MTDFTNQKVNHQVFGPGTILGQWPTLFVKPSFMIQFSDDQKYIPFEDFENLASFADPVFQEEILNLIQQKDAESMSEDIGQPHREEINLDEIFANLPEEFGLNDLIAQVVLQKMKKENQDLKDIL